MKKYNVGILGATGAVGVYKALHRRDGEHIVSKLDGFDLPLTHELDQFAVRDLLRSRRVALSGKHRGNIVDTDRCNQRPDHERKYAAAVLALLFG